MFRTYLWTLLTLTTIGCGGAASGPQEGGAGSDSLLGSIYVDAVLGTDSLEHGESDEKPVKSITYALKKTNPRSIIVANGVYNTSNGESFPIVIPTGVRVIGKDFLRNGSTYARIEGCGASHPTDTPTTIILKGGTLEYIGVSCSHGSATLLESAATESHIINSVLYDSLYGAILRGKGAIIYSAAINNSSNGFYIQSGASVRLFDNLITNNKVGLTIEDGADANFINETGTTGMSILANIDCDFRHFGQGTISLQGTIWDDPETEFSVLRKCSDGANISVEGFGSVIFGQLANPTTPLFSTERRIELISPIASQLTSSTTPTIYWLPSGSRLAAAAIFSKIPSVGIHGIENTKDIVWFWNSGLGGGFSGQMSYSGGLHPIGGDLSRLESPIPLQSGRTYYWVVWEWNELNGQVSASSPIGIFRTQP